MGVQSVVLVFLFIAGLSDRVIVYTDEGPVTKLHSAYSYLARALSMFKWWGELRCPRLMGMGEGIQPLEKLVNETFNRH